MVPVTKPYLPDRARFDRYVDRIYSSCRLTNHGPLVQELTDRLKSYLGISNLLLVANGTLALQIAYRAVGLNGAVVTTPFSFVATVSSLIWESLRPVFVDIDKETLSIDPELLDRLNDQAISGIVPVHVYGNPCNVDAIETIAQRKSWKVIYDAAHAFGTSINGKSLLSYGDASVISFHATKLFHTIEGGAIVFKDPEHFERAQRMIAFGISDDGAITDLGINCKMNEFQAAMGLAVLDEIDLVMDERRKIWELYEAMFEGKVQRPRRQPGTENYAYYPVILSSEEQVQTVMNTLRGMDISPRRYFYPSLDSLPYVDRGAACPVARDIARRVLCFPLFPGLTEATIRQISDVVLATTEI